MLCKHSALSDEGVVKKATSVTQGVVAVARVTRSGGCCAHHWEWRLLRRVTQGVVAVAHVTGSGGCCAWSLKEWWLLRLRLFLSEKIARAPHVINVGCQIASY